MPLVLHTIYYLLLDLLVFCSIGNIHRPRRPEPSIFSGTPLFVPGINQGDSVDRPSFATRMSIFP